MNCRRVVSTGHIIEVYEYEKMVFSGFKSKGGRKKQGEEIKHEERKEEYRKTVGYRAREKVRRTINANFGQHSKFITLTFRDGSVNDVSSVDECNYEYKKFIQRLRDKGFIFKYLSVIEFQDSNGRGAVHYHMITDLPYIENKVLADIWGNGFVRINDISHVDNVGAYVVKYMTKDNGDIRLKGKKMYLNSRGLDKPEVFRGEIAIDLIKYYDLDRKKEVFQSSYESEHFGNVKYKEYNLKRI